MHFEFKIHQEYCDLHAMISHKNDFLIGLLPAPQVTQGPLPLDTRRTRIATHITNPFTTVSSSSQIIATDHHTGLIAAPNHSCNAPHSEHTWKEAHRSTTQTHGPPNWAEPRGFVTASH